MKPSHIGRSYDRIASRWDEDLAASSYGVTYLRRAVGLCERREEALDLGCGSGGRMMAALLEAGFDVTGLDVSREMLRLARKRHPEVTLIQADLCRWMPATGFDLVLAWDSTFHVAHRMQRPVTEAMCDAVSPGGVLLFTAGGSDGERTGTMHGVRFYYSSLQDLEYLDIIRARGLTCVLMERDQHPEDHVVFVARRG